MMTKSRFSYQSLLAVVGGVIGLGLVGAWSYSQGRIGADSDAIIQGVALAYTGDRVYIKETKIRFWGNDAPVMNRVVRLWGIDAPEMGRVAGGIAYQSLKDYVNGKWVECRPPPGEVEFPIFHNHKVARCTLEGVDLALYQVKYGHARDWPEFSNSYYRNIKGSIPQRR